MYCVYLLQKWQIDLAVAGWDIGGIRRRIGGQHQSVLALKNDAICFVTFRISDWRSLEFMTLDKLEILDIWTTIFFRFLYKSGINWCRICFLHHLSAKSYDESFPIRTKTVWCSISIPLIHCILFLRWSNIIWQG